MAKARVAVLKTKPDTVLEDVGRTMEMGDVRKYLASGSTTITVKPRSTSSCAAVRPAIPAPKTVT